jgi:4-amino-4-deoxy-L-arabinose transferase-like glycosyltransferase
MRKAAGRQARSPRTFVAVTLGRVPTAAWICALIALLNACAWSLIVPPFQGKDEVDHFAYVEQVVENGTLPENGGLNGTYSAEETLVLAGLHYTEVAHSPQTPSISTVAEERTLTKDLHAGQSLRGSGEAGVATPEPPLYYLLQIVPYELGRGNILTQLQLMRLVSALFGAMTALLTFLFLREALPRRPWAATVGALCVALQPLLAFMSGSVNPDAMLFTVSAGVLLCLARAFRRGLTLRLSVWLGVLIAVGFLTKLNFAGFAFGVFVGLAVLGARGVKARGLAALLPPLIAAIIAVSPVTLYVLRNILTNRPTLGIISANLELISTESLFNAFSYIWQIYLPRLPGMTPYFTGIATYKDIWFDRSVGLYGVFDTMFPAWVDNVALIPAAAVALLCGRELFVRRGELRARLSELAVYALIALGVLVMIGASSYLSDALDHGAAFGEPRYLLPLLPLFGAVIALAVRGAGRWAPVVGAALVILVFGHDLFSQLQVLARYYG